MLTAVIIWSLDSENFSKFVNYVFPVAIHGDAKQMTQPVLY